MPAIYARPTIYIVLQIGWLARPSQMMGSLKDIAAQISGFKYILATCGAVRVLVEGSWLKKKNAVANLTAS